MIWLIIIIAIVVMFLFFCVGLSTINSKKQDQEISNLREYIDSEFKEYGFEKEEVWLYILGKSYRRKNNPLINTRIELIELERKHKLLLTHLGLEYFKKEVKETNGSEKEYVEEGFRKIK